ncbi:MAG: tetratricopeptide repeat protein [bacterium]|nr:tetratricopeptide repeat protein [bacterium]
MKTSLKAQTKIIIALISVYVIFFGIGRYRQYVGNRFFQSGTQALQEGNYGKAIIDLERSLLLSPRSNWAEQAKNELAFSQIIQGESTQTRQNENTSLFDWLTSSAVLALAAVIIVLLMIGGYLHFGRLSRVKKLEEYVAYLKTVEHRIKVKMKPTVEGQNTSTYDGVGDYQNYIDYYKKSEYVLLANCLIAEYQLGVKPEDQELSQQLEKDYAAFIASYPESSYLEEIQQKLGNLCFFNIHDFDKARAAYKVMLEKYPQSRWIKIAQARIRLIEDNPEENYEPLCMYVRAERLYEDKKYDDSLEIFRKLIAGFGQTKLAIEAQFSIAEIYMYKTNQTERAIEEYQKIVDIYGQSSFAGKAMYKIGECYKKLQKAGEAITAYEKFIANYPQADFLDYAYYYVALCSEQLKDNRKALDTYQKIIKDFPDSIWVVVAESRIAALSQK